MIIVVLIIVNFFLAIVVDAYSEVKSSASVDDQRCALASAKEERHIPAARIQHTLCFWHALPSNPEAFVITDGDAGGRQYAPHTSLSDEDPSTRFGGECTRTRVLAVERWARCASPRRRAEKSFLHAPTIQDATQPRALAFWNICPVRVLR
jgi:hypothetical protein